MYIYVTQSVDASELPAVAEGSSQLLEKTSKTETAYVKDEDVELVEIDQSGVTDITQNISSHSAATEDGKEQIVDLKTPATSANTFGERALEIEPTKFVLESIFEEAETDILDNEAELPERATPKYNKTYVFSTATELPESAAAFHQNSENTLKVDDDVHNHIELLDEFNSLSPAGGYFCCLGRLIGGSQKLLSLVSETTGLNPVHVKSGYTELICTCDKVIAMLGDAKNFAMAGLEAVQNQIEDESEMLDNNIFIEHDPVKRPSTLTRNQQKYLINLGPCQPKLSIYPRNLALIKKGKQSSFSQTWCDDYTYLEGSVMENKAYCFICTIFEEEGYQRERSEKARIEGMDD